MVAIVLTIGAFFALAAWMSHGDEENWFKGTISHVGILVCVLSVIFAVGWVMEYGT